MDIEEAVSSPFALADPKDRTLEGRKVCVITMGCAHNQADSDAIASAFL